MKSNDVINNEIKELKKQLSSNKISDEDKQIIRDKLLELYNELKHRSGNIERRIVPVETNSIIADRCEKPNSRFIDSSTFRI